MMRWLKTVKRHGLVIVTPPCLHLWAFLKCADNFKVTKTKRNKKKKKKERKKEKKP